MLPKESKSFRPTTTAPLSLCLVSNNSIPSNLPSLFRMCSLCPCSWRRIAGNRSIVWHVLLCSESGSSLKAYPVTRCCRPPNPAAPNSWLFGRGKASGGCSALRYGGTFCPSKSCYLCSSPHLPITAWFPNPFLPSSQLLSQTLTFPLVHLNVSPFFASVISCLS